MTGSVCAIAGGLSFPPGTFNVASGTNSLHGSNVTFTGTSGTVALNGNVNFMTSSTLQPTQGKDLVILVGHSESLTTITMPAGWTNLYYTGSTNIVAYKISPGGETDVTINLGGGGGRFLSCTYTIRGYSRIPAVEIASSSGTSKFPDPPLLTQSWGTSAPSIHIAAAIGYGDVSGYPGIPFDEKVQSTLLTGGRFCSLTSQGPGLRASGNPGSFTMLSLDVWTAHTIAVRGR